jgi:hypothetical protein
MYVRTCALKNATQKMKGQNKGQKAGKGKGRLLCRLRTKRVRKLKENWEYEHGGHRAVKNN